MSFLVKLYHIKCLRRMSDKAMTMILELLHDASEHAKIPSSFYEAKKFINKLGLNYEKITACPNNCMLYWGNQEDEERETCKVCNICLNGNQGQLQNEINNSATENMAFVKVFGSEHPGCLRGVGFGVTETQIEGSTYRSSDLAAANAKIQKLQTEVDGLKTQVVEMDALKAKLVYCNDMKAQVASLMQNFKGNQAADLQLPREVIRSAFCHDPEDCAASSSHRLN